jgi:hypothetical protein
MRRSTSKEKQTFNFSSAFHISIGWTLKQPSAKMIDATTTTINSTGLETFKTSNIQVDAVKVKVGNVVNSIPLLSKDPEEENLYSGSK